jgi:hypothetical protein
VKYRSNLSLDAPPCPCLLPLAGDEPPALPLVVPFGAFLPELRSPSRSSTPALSLQRLFWLQPFQRRLSPLYRQRPSLCCSFYLQQLSQRRLFPLRRLSRQPLSAAAFCAAAFSAAFGGSFFSSGLFRRFRCAFSQPAAALSEHPAGFRRFCFGFLLSIGSRFRGFGFSLFLRIGRRFLRRGFGCFCLGISLRFRVSCGFARFLRFFRLCSALLSCALSSRPLQPVSAVPSPLLPLPAPANVLSSCFRRSCSAACFSRSSSACCCACFSRCSSARFALALLLLLAIIVLHYRTGIHHYGIDGRTSTAAG